MRTGVASLLVLLVSAAGGWWIVSILYGAESGWRVGGALVAVFVAAAALAIARHESAWGYFAAGWLMLGALIVPVMLFSVASPGGATSPFGIPLTFSSTAIIGLALIVAAALVYGAMTRDAGRLGLLVVAGLLLVLGFYALFWLMVWDSTYDPIGMILLPFLILVGVLAGGALALLLPRPNMIAGLLFALFVPAGLILVTTFAQRPGFRAITESRAGSISRALQSFYTREGHYPQVLQQLVPRDVLYISRPVVIFGQKWCYDGAGDAYQLGYVDREHWSDPHLMDRAYKTAGDVAGLGPLCAVEIDTLIRQYPDFFELRE